MLIRRRQWRPATYCGQELQKEFPQDKADRRAGNHVRWEVGGALYPCHADEGGEHVKKAPVLWKILRDRVGETESDSRMSRGEGIIAASQGRADKNQILRKSRSRTAYQVLQYLRNNA